jgi:hypothetical protein
VSGYQAFKVWVQGYLHLAKDALHVHVGLAIFLGAALLFRWPLRSWKPWLLAAAAALAGEIWDLRDTLMLGRAIPWAGQGKDLVSTIFWPTILMLLARWTRVLKRS